MVGQRSIDDILVLNRPAVEAQTREELQKILDLYETGIQVNTVALQTTRPPDQVRARLRRRGKRTRGQGEPYQRGQGL